MRTKLIPGKGVCGMQLTLSLGDMFQANQMSDTINEVIKNHEECTKYDKTPYDKRSEIFPEGKPVRIEMRDEDLDKVYILLAKMSYAADSTIFKEEDEEPVEKDDDLFGGDEE